MIESVIDFIREQNQPVSTRVLSSRFGLEHMTMFNALNAEAARGRLERTLAFNSTTLCIGWVCPAAN